MTQPCRPLLSEQNKAWHDQFTQKHGRKPRVLHIGNIANNAYNNAKLLNEAGFDCDVLSYDYYHMMGAPEWEDAFISGDYGSDFYPEWYKVNLNGFTRPRWFAQGSFEDSTDYLIAKRTQHSSCASLWEQLCIQSRLSPPSLKYPILSSLTLIQPYLDFPIARSFYSGLQVLRHKGIIFISLRIVLGFQYYLFSFLLCLTLGELISRSVIGQIFRGLRGPKPKSKADKSSRQISIQGQLLIIFQNFLARCTSTLNRYILNSYHRSDELSFPESQHSLVRIISIVRRFKECFPQRPDQLSLADVIPYLKASRKLEKLLLHYDIVIAYATSPIPVLLTANPYFTLEHGTLRDIPYVQSAVGRLTTAAYSNALHTFVTNTDCCDSAQFLTRGEFSIINHPYSEKRSYSESYCQEQRRLLLEKLSSDFLIFHPTRLDWIAGTGFADKNNIVLLEAFIALRQKGFKPGLILCEWGNNVREAKDIIRKNSLMNNVYFVNPMPVKQFEIFCKASDILADQFKLGAFGGVTFKSMCVGTPVLTYINQAEILRNYPEELPVINAQASIDLERSIQIVYRDPSILTTLGQKGLEWISRFHSGAATINLQVNQFRRFINP